MDVAERNAIHAELRARRAKPVAGGEQDHAGRRGEEAVPGRPMAATLQELWQEREKVRQANSERSKAAHARAKAKREAERG